MTTPIRLSGVTWDHPRAYEGLEAETARFNRAQDRIRLSWNRHSLREFEEKPIEVTAAAYDLVILDHPFMGDAAASGCLHDLGRFPDLLVTDSLAGAFVGPSFASYVLDGTLWALPIDAACQTAALRPDLMENLGAEMPATLDQLLAFAARHRIGLAMSCPHAFMNFLTICGLLGADISGEAERLVPRSIGIEALEILRELVARAPAEAGEWSSIGLLDAMAERDDIAYCPMVFCFNSYARPAGGRGGNRVAFGSLVEMRPGRGTGGVVAGGAGLAISSASRHPREAAVVVAYLMSAEAQVRMAVWGGQPARREVWFDSEADRANGGFFGGVLATMSGALVRPRYAGYLSLQNRAGDILKAEAIGPSRPAAGVVDEIGALFQAGLRTSMRGRSQPA